VRFERAEDITSSGGVNGSCRKELPVSVAVVSGDAFGFLSEAGKSGASVHGYASDPNVSGGGTLILPFQSRVLDCFLRGGLPASLIKAR
jgi:hypothetical protein